TFTSISSVSWPNSLRALKFPCGHFQERSVERAARGSSWNGHIPAARAEGRNFAVIVFSHGQGFELFDRSECPLYIFRILGVIGTTGGIIGTPFGWRPFFLQRLVTDRTLQALCQGHCTERDCGFHERLPSMRYTVKLYWVAPLIPIVGAAQ